MYWLPIVALRVQNLLASAPFEFYRGEVVAKVRICGKGPFTVLFDTGTAPSIIDLALAQRLGIKTEATGHAGSGGGTEAGQAYVTSLPQVQVDRYTLKSVPCLAMDLSGLSKRLGRRLDGVFGDSVFDRHVVQFDYPNRVVRFLKKTPDSSGIRFHFTHSDSEVHLKGIRVNGRKVIGNLDTGANASFQVTPKGIRKLRLDSLARNGHAMESAGFNGAYQSHSGRLARIDLGFIHKESQNATFWLPGTGHDDRAFDVNIGNGFWKSYVVTIDYIHHVVSLSHD